MTWYLASTRCQLTRAPRDNPEHRTQEEQLQGGIDRTTADRRDYTVNTSFLLIFTIFITKYYVGLTLSVFFCSLLCHAKSWRMCGK